jgi:dienelactone hydrolase
MDGFSCTHRQDFNPEAAARAEQRSFEFLKNALP